MYSIDNTEHSDKIIDSMHRTLGGIAMNTEKVRKTDRRTLYTRMVVKESLLKLLSEKDYGNITVADICREAELNRGTFYLHYNNIPQVVEELFDDALKNMHSVLAQIGCTVAADEKCTYPLCRFLRENKQYQPLFFSDSLRTRAIERLADSSRENYITKLREKTKLSQEVLEAIFYFQLNGCLAVSKRNIGIPDKAWSEIQCGVDALLKNGFQNL